MEVVSILYTITEKTSIEYLQLIEYFSTNLLHFEKRCDIMIASKGKPDAFSGKRSEKGDRTHKIFYFRDSMSRTRAVRQFRSGECAPQGVAMPCGKGGTMRLCRFGTPSKATAFGHSRHGVRAVKGAASVGEIRSKKGPEMFAGGEFGGWVFPPGQRRR